MHQPNGCIPPTVWLNPKARKPRADIRKVDVLASFEYTPNKSSTTGKLGFATGCFELT
jgi:hypothetical protein